MEELKQILGFEDRYNHPEIKLRKIEKGFEIDYSQMYDAPTLSFAILKKLSDFFGTDEIDVDNYSHGGCET